LELLPRPNLPSAFSKTLFVATGGLADGYAFVFLAAGFLVTTALDTFMVLFSLPSSLAEAALPLLCYMSMNATAQ